MKISDRGSIAAHACGTAAREVRTCNPGCASENAHRTGFGVRAHMYKLLHSMMVIALACAAMSASGADKDDVVKADPVQAIWKPQEITFYFQSFTTFYSCEGLETKLERILRTLGAEQAKVQVRSADCSARVVTMPRVVATVLAPVEATPEAIAERDKDKGRRELVARLNRKQQEFEALNEQFPANWKRVSLSRGSLNLEPGDCELIDEVRRKVLPQLAVRIVNDDISCSPGQLSLGQPQLEVEALVAAPKPDDPSSKKE